MAKSDNSFLDPRRIRFQGLSIQQRLPLLICVLLLSVLLAFSFIAYVGLRNSAVSTGKQRLESLSRQLSTLFGQSMQALIVSTAGGLQNPDLLDFARSGGADGQDGTKTALYSILKDSQTVLMEIRDPAHRQLLRLGRDSASPRISHNPDAMTIVNRTINPGIGEIVQSADSLFYPIFIPLTQNKITLGYVVRWRILTASAKAIRQFNDLIGTDANMYVSNADGTLWTDLRAAVPAPFDLDTARLKAPFTYKNSDGRAILASAKMIPGTPWAVTTGFSRTLILAPAKSFLRMTLVAGGIILFAGILLAWRMSRNIIRPLESLTQAAALMASGQYSKPVPVHRKDEVGNLARAFNAMMLKIQKGKKEMEKQLAETRQLNEQLRNLSAHLQNIREEERIHIAREMHDELGGLLTGFKMDVAGLQKKFSEGDPVINEKLTSMKAMTDDAVKFVRKLAAELRPSILDDLGLVPALEWHAREFEKRYGIPVVFDYDEEEVEASSLVATGLFRIYQESLTNVARHSDATEVSSGLHIHHGVIEMMIRDNGKGFDLNDKRKTLGLLGMKERAVMIGGKLTIESAPGKGTSVMITVPVK